MDFENRKILVKKSRINKNKIVKNILYIIFFIIMALLAKNYIFKQKINSEIVYVFDKSNNNVIFEKNKNKKISPASLSKLFLTDYIIENYNLDTVISPSDGILEYVPKNSSLANIEYKEYTLRNLVAGLLVPSGNDAAYVLADFCGKNLDKSLRDIKTRLDLFQEKFNIFLRDRGYENTKIYNPSGFDYESYTTCEDLNNVVNNIIQYKFIREVISSYEYIASLPDDTDIAWINTNKFLDPNFKYFSKKIKGTKTGSLDGINNLILLYNKGDREYIIHILGSKTDKQRYEEANEIIKRIIEK
ncbi:D-alanyl-D-alanine carboxypeptidase family protein [Helcococcus ovis]|uniref:D-alanyl-D-alanine carboxypeptidase family protein n=2 Tax=Helcococcus ovis TaxID=72026 RepID=UPI0010700302|nr:serine hydrolase [Helcococcus ovis]WNZ01734.1 serine hydrolase [Helcococcus ovis]